MAQNPKHELGCRQIHVVNLTASNKLPPASRHHYQKNPLPFLWRPFLTKKKTLIPMMNPFLTKKKTLIPMMNPASVDESS
jgi:hypothetical protein